jgi:alanine racemase
VHAANTAGAIAFADARFDLVRVGIGIYGIAPSAALAGRVPLTPVMSVKARVTHVKRLGEGARVSYGLRYRLAREATIATVPIGYGDGVPRSLGAAGGEVLVGGHRHPIAGTVTMDQLMVDTGDTPVEVGDEVVLLGTQGDAEITADEWAARLGTIPYEIVCAIGPRVPRRYLG